MDEKHFAEIEVAMLYIEELVSAPTERPKRFGPRAPTTLDRGARAITTELSEVARRLRQGTYFAVPKEQLNL